MRASERRAERLLATRLRDRAQAGHLPPYAPLAAAHAAGMEALRAGATLDEACEAGWAQIEGWARRWPSPATGAGWSSPTLATERQR